MFGNGIPPHPDPPPGGGRDSWEFLMLLIFEQMKWPKVPLPYRVGDGFLFDSASQYKKRGSRNT